MKEKIVAFIALSGLAVGGAIAAETEVTTTTTETRSSAYEYCTVVHGAQIKSSDGAEIGSISDLIIDPAGGQIVAAVVTVGGAEKLTLIPWSAVRFAPGEKVVTVNVERERILSAPSFTKAEIGSLDPQRIESSRSYFSSRKAARPEQRETTPRDSAAQPSEEREKKGQGEKSTAQKRELPEPVGERDTKGERNSNKPEATEPQKLQQQGQQEERSGKQEQENLMQPERQKSLAEPGSKEGNEQRQGTMKQGPAAAESREREPAQGEGKALQHEKGNKEKAKQQEGEAGKEEPVKKERGNE